MEQPTDARFRVQRSLATVHGEEIAALCMDMMPELEVDRLVTAPLLDGAVVLIRKDMDHGFTEIRSEMRAGFTELRQDMNHEFAEIRSEMRAGFTEQSKVLSEQIASSVNQSLRWSIVTMVSMQAVLVAAVRLL